MKLTNNCKKLLKFFIKNNYINHDKQSTQTQAIIKQLYDDIYKSYQYLLELKSIGKDLFYNYKIKKINTVKQIPKPNNFNMNSFPEKIRNHIDDFSFYEIEYSFNLFNRNINIYFIIENEDIERKIKTYHKYVDSIIMWLYILNEYSSKQCSKKLKLYFYFTCLKKEIPHSNIDILDEFHINTAFTSTCPSDSEIVVYRKEDWFKVFIHETFHNFALDFSDMNNTNCHKMILEIFNVNSKVNLYEAYTEFWAEIMNALFCSFFILKDKKDFDEFIFLSEFFINLEVTYSFFQLVKILKFMGLKYNNLYSNTKESIMLRNNFYKENTNILSYYVIKTVLINNYQSFLLWCNNNNFSLLQFKKTNKNQTEFCKFIEEKYKTRSMLDRIKLTETFLDNKNNFNKQYDTDFILNNLRMTLCELG
jgi:hypothetical protein